MSYLSESAYRKLFSYRIVGPDEGWKFYKHLKANPKLILAYDIETADSVGISEEIYDDLESTDITQIQFAVDKYNAIIFPRFDGNYKELSQTILSLPNITVSFNGWAFDNPILRRHSTEVDESRCHDLMWMFHHYQPKLPRGLQAVASFAGFPFPWKHLFGANMELYGGADVCSLHFILDYLPGLMKKIGVYGGYLEYVYKFRGKMLFPAQREGIPVNNRERLKLREKFIGIRDELDKGLQESVPLELRNFTPRKKVKVKDTDTGKEFEVVRYGYEREPKREIAKGREEYERGVKILTERGKRAKSFNNFLADRYQLVKRRFRDINYETGAYELGEERWCKVQPFKASFDQLSRYIKWKQGELARSGDKEKVKLSKLWEVPKNHEGKETTAKGEIETLSEKVGADAVLDNVLDIRSINTNINNYIPNWIPSPLDGCVHTTFGFSASSGQIDSRRPNVLNVSKWTEYGQLFRRIIEAPEGWEFIEYDHRSFHVATMGYIANDPSYIRFSQLDPHTIFASHIAPKGWIDKPITMDLSDGEIKEKCKWLKDRIKVEGSMLRQQAKPVVLGNQLGLGPNKLYWINRKYIESRSRAKEYQTMLGELFPKVEAAKKHIKQLAADRTYLINEFGHIQWFFDVYNWTWNKRLNGGKGGWEQKEGEEARDAVAFAVQSPAFGMIKDEGMRIEPRLQELTKERLLFRLSIHDSLIFMYPRQFRERIIEIGLEEMEKPCGKLVNGATGPKGLGVGVEYSIGRNWMKWHETENPEGMKEMG